MVRIKPKWLLGAMVALVALVALPAVALAEAPTGVNIVSPTNTSKAAVAAGNNVYVTFNYTSVPMEANTTSATIQVVDPATSTVVGERTYAYPAIQDTGPGGAQFTGNVTIDSGAAEGKYDVVVTVTNHDGSAGDTETEAVIVDNSRPDDVAFVTAPPYTNDTTPTFTWVAPDDNGTPPSGIAGYRVEIWDPAGPTRVRGPYTGVTDEDPVLGDVQWTLPDADALPPGSYEVRVWAVDRAANESANPGTDSFVIDTTAPVLDQQGPTGYTNDDTPTLSVRFRDLGAAASGYDATNSPLSFTLDDGSVLPPTHNPLDGALVDSITKDVAPAITQGDHTAYIKVQDRAGNTAELTWNFFVDSVAPNGPASVTAPEYTADSTPDFYWPVAEDNGPSDEQSGVGTYTVEIWSTGVGPVRVRGPYTGVTDGNPATPEVDWTLPDALSVDGEYEIRVYSVDNAGNTSALYASDTFKLDTTSPTLDWEQPASGSWTSDTTPTLSVRFRDTGAGASGYDQAASPTAFTLDGSPLGDPDSEPGDGSVGPAYITKGVTTALGDGAHTVSITVEDRVGNSTTHGWTFNVDNTPPSDPTNVTLPDATPDPTPPPAYWTNDSTPKFQWDEATDTGGSGVASYDVEIWVSGGASAEKTYSGVTDQDVAPGVQWTIPDALTEEIYEVRVYSVDVAGNRSTGYGSTTFGVDITINPLMLDQQLPTGFINDATPLLSVRFRDLGYPASGYDAADSPTSFTLDGSPLGDPDTEPDAGDTLGYITKQITSDLGQGSHSVYIAVEDLAGNSADLTWGFFVDTIPPDTPTGVTAPDQTNDPTPAFSWDSGTDPGEGAVPPTGSGVGSYKVEIWSGGARVLGPYTAMTDESGDPGFQWTLPDPLPADGAYEIRVWSVDNATNVSETYGFDTFNFDTTNPVLDNESPTGYINDASPALSVRFTDSGAGASGYDKTWSPNVFKLDGGDITPDSEPGDGALTGNITKNVGPLAEGTHTVDITVRDLAQNVASLTWHFTVDLTPPDPPGSVTAREFTNDTTPTFNWTAGSDTGSGIASYIVEVWTTGGGAAMIRGPYMGITDLSFTIPASDALSPDGDYQVRVWSVDRAGNTSGTYGGGGGEGGYTADTFTLDTGKPTLMNGAPTGLLNSLQVTFTADYADDRSGFAIVPPLNPWMRYQDADDGATWTNVGAISGPSVGALTGQIKGESWPGTPITLPNDGTWTVRLTAFDRAGNNTDNPDPYSWTFTVDTTAPTFSNPYPAEETTTWDKWTEIHVKITDPLASDGTEGSGVDGDSLECYIDGPGMIPWDLPLDSWDPATGEAVFTQPIGLDLADGTYTAHVSAYDVAGNSGSYEWVFEVRQAYAPGMNAEPEFTQGTQNTVSWTDVDNEEYYNVEVSEDPSFGTVSMGETAPAGTTSATFDLQDGHTYYYRVQAIAYGGRVSLWSNIVSSTQDATAPTAPGTPSTASPTNDTTPTWTWAAATDATSGVVDYNVQLWNTSGGPLSFDGWIGNTTTWTVPDGAITADGQYGLIVKAKDALGQESAWSVAGFVTIDTTGPTVTAGPDPTSPTNNPRPTWAWTGDDGSGPGVTGVKGYWVTLDGEASIWTTGTSFTPGADLPDGDHVLKVKGVDNVGNEGIEVTLATVTVDTTPPAVPGMPHTETPTNDTTPTWTWAGVEGAASYNVYLDDELVDNVTAPSYTVPEDEALGEGQHHLQVSSLDDLDNESALSEAGYVVIDTTPPAAPAMLPLPEFTNADEVIFIWSQVTDAVKYDFFYSVDGGSNWNPVPDLTVQTYTLDISDASDGDVIMGKVVAYDAAGNDSDESNEVQTIVDRTGPELDAVSPDEPVVTPDPRPTWEWSGSDEVSGVRGYMVTLDGEAAGWTTENSFTPSGNLADGEHVLLVVGVDNAGNETPLEFPTVTIDATAPDAPVMAAEPEFTQGLANTVSWGDVSGEARYHVQCSSDSTFSTVDSEDDTVTGTSKEFAGLQDGVTYYYRVRAIDELNNVSFWSNIVNSTQDASPPFPIGSMPTITPLVTNGDVLTFQWQTAIDEVSGIGAYRLELSYLAPDGTEDTGDEVLPGEVTTYTASDAPEGRWMVRARAIDKVGNEGDDEYWSPWSLPAIVDRTAPAVPTMVTEPSYTPGTSNTVSWGAVDDVGVPEAVSGLAGYDVQMSTSAEFPAGSPIQSVEAGVTSATFTGLAPGQTYYYRVRAKDAAGNVGEWSEPTSSTQDPNPLAAPVMAAEPEFTQGTSNTVSWGAVSGADRYHVQCSTDSTFATITAEDENVTGTSKTFESLSDGVTYHYRVCAIDTDASEPIASEWSNIVHSTQDASGPSAPGTPSTPSPTTNKRPTWTWAAATDAGIGVADYWVELSVGEAVPTIVPRNGGGSVVYEGWVGNVTSWTCGADLDDGTYELRVKAKDAFDQEGAWSDPGYVTIDTTAPGVPTDLAVTSPTADNTPTWTWTASTGDVASYEVSLDGAAAVDIANVTSFTPSALADGRHNLKVRALDALRNASAWAGPAEVLVDTVAPVITLINPENGARLNITTASTILADLFDSGSGVDQARVWLKIDGGEWVAPTAIVGGTLYYVVNLPFEATDDKWHSIEIKAKDVVGNETRVHACFKVELYREGFGFGRLRFPEESD
ncbi:MAG: fibronectin type III domain-containing protein [Bacteroidota bacterium]